MRVIKGICASPGIVIGKAFVYIDDDDLGIPNYAIRPEEVEGEWARFLAAVNKATSEVTELRNRALKEMGAKQSAIFDSHIMMLNDPEFMDQIEEKLKSTLKNIEWIIYQLEQQLVKKLGESQDQYIREKTSDIHDISKRIFNHLLFRERVSLADIGGEVILVAHNLLPSEAIVMNKEAVKGIATDVGGKTSHTAILARAFEIPAVLGLSEVTKLVHHGDTLIIDGESGLVVVDPDKETERRYRVSRSRIAKHDKDLANIRELPASTKDGNTVLLKANIEIPEEAEAALRHGAEGIGLYRSEFLFLQPESFSTEDAQYEAYARVLDAMTGKPVTIRTLDLGGDKMTPELEVAGEKNPLLGWRAIRYCLSRPEVFKTQLRAMLRASSHGDLRIMFPMISGAEELEEALKVLGEARQEVTARGIKVKDDIPVGIMIEVPSAALTADILARKVSFFSIGTNDLIQYTIAADRGNEKTAYLYQPFHPGILRLLSSVIEAAHAQGIPVSMCGEMASDPYASVILLGLGLDEFSMSSHGIPEVKRIIRAVSFPEAKNLAKKVLSMGSYVEIDGYVRSWMNERFKLEE